jgi:hypothetical protein
VYPLITPFCAELNGGVEAMTRVPVGAVQLCKAFRVVKMPLSIPELPMSKSFADAALQDLTHCFVN